jgi:hypothetical protein
LYYLTDNRLRNYALALGTSTSPSSASSRGEAPRIRNERRLHNTNDR